MNLQQLEFHRRAREEMAAFVDTFIKAVKAKQREKGMSDAELGRRMGITRQQAHQLMNKHPNNITVKTMVRIAQAVDLPFTITVRPLSK